jgi:hypothetical protein
MVNGKWCSICSAILGIVVMNSCGPTARSAPPTRQELRDTLKQHWDSIETLEFQCEESNANEKGEPDRSRGFTRLYFAMGSGARRAAKTYAVYPDREVLAEDVREDGKKRYGIQWAPDQSGKIDQLFITNQEDTNERFTGPMSRLLYLLMPFGKALYAHLDDGAKIEAVGASPGPSRVAILFKDQDHPVRLELDEAHDWLPSRMVMENINDVTVTRFERIDGRWFPVEGHEYEVIRKRHTVFKASNIHFNRPIPATTFSAASLKNDGMIVSDSTKKSARIVGGMEAREKLAAEHLPKPATPRVPITASTEPTEFPWRAGIATISVLAILAAGVLTWRRSHA